MEEEKELNTSLFKRDLEPILILTGLIIFFFNQVLFTPKTFVFRDYYYYFYPIRYYAWESIRNGIIPLWNPYLFCGAPFLANLQSCIFYPPSIILYLLPFHFGLKFFVIFHFFLAGLFMYLLLKDFGLERSACLVGSITFTFSGYLLSVVDMLTSLTSAVWIPLVFLFFNRAINSGFSSKFEIKWIILTGVSIGVQFLGGEPTVLYATLMALFLFALAKGIVQGLRRLKFSLLSAFYSLFAVCIIGLGLTLFQVLPFLEMVLNSIRLTESTYESVTFWSSPPYGLVNLILPYIWKKESWIGIFLFGQQWLKSMYIGILPFFLMVLSFFYIKRKAILFWSLLFFFFIAFSCGDYLPLYRLGYNYLPLLRFIQYPVKFIVISTFSASILTSFGFNLFEHHRRSLKPFLAIIILLFLIWVVDSSARTSRWGCFGSLFSELAEMGSIGRGIIEHLLSNLLVSTILLGITLPILLIRSKYSSILLLLLIIVNLFYFGIGLNPIITEDVYYYRPEILKILKEDKDIFRFIVSHKLLTSPLPAPTYKDVLKASKIFLKPNFALVYHLFDVRGRDSIFLRDYAKILDLLDSSKGLLNLLNVKYIFSPKILKDGFVVILDKNPSYLPRSFVVPEAVVITKKRWILERLLSPEFDPLKEVILEEEISKVERVDYLLE